MKRMHMEPLPAQGGDVVASALRYVRRAMTTPKVHRIEISPKGILVEREMSDPDEPVVPGGTNEVDIGFLVSSIDIMALPFDPKQHGMYALYAAALAAGEKGREVFTLAVPGWPLFAAWLGVDEAPQPKTVLGMHLTVVPSNVTNGRVVMLCAKPSSLFLSDVDYGVAIDLGV